MKRITPYKNLKIFRFIACFNILLLALACGPPENRESKSPQGSDSMDSTLYEAYWDTSSTNSKVIARQPVVKPAFDKISLVMQGNGYITFDMRRSHKIPVQTEGRIERLYVKYNYQYIKRGQKILDLYSPELNAYIAEYVYIKERTYDSLLQKSARQKLLLLGLRQSQIEEIDRKGQATFTISIFSPFEGYVMFAPSAGGMQNSENASGGMDVDMKNSSIQSSKPGLLSDNSIREGMYVSKGQTLFWINDFKEVWGILSFNGEYERFIRSGLVAEIESEMKPDQPFRTTIQFTEPWYQQGQKHTQTRIYISNKNRIFRQNSLLKARVLVTDSAMTLPESCIFYLGRSAIAWVQTGMTREGSKIFQARKVKIGRKLDDRIEILEGIMPNEAVARDASYLADSETIIHVLNEAYEK